jgi:adenylate kinase family enzyme
VKREGLDTPESIKVRLQQYRDRTFPIFEFFLERGFEIKKINGEQNVSQVYEDLLKAIS